LPRTGAGKRGEGYPSVPAPATVQNRPAGGPSSAAVDGPNFRRRLLSPAGVALFSCNCIETLIAKPAMSRSFAPTTLMLGNFATGVSIIGPTGMLPELARGLDVSIREASLLITFGAVMLCIGSPVMAWLTSRFDRRVLLTFTVLVLAVANL